MTRRSEERQRFWGGAFSLLRVLGWIVVAIVGVVLLLVVFLVARVAITGGN
jgi:hypothetical protein